jgi:hypothetical protein
MEMMRIACGLALVSCRWLDVDKQGQNTGCLPTDAGMLLYAVSKCKRK